MESNKIITRRHDIDWLRVIAIALLLLYHVSIGFQKWGLMIGFITNSESLDSIWTPMTMLNVWRIPLLFFVSGIGVYFAIQKRDWKQLLKERTVRIFVPYIFGIIAIVPIHMYFLQLFYNFDTSYNANPSHLWFLGNIFAYVIILLPIFTYLKKNIDGKLASWIKKAFSNPLGLLIVIAFFIIETLLVEPSIYEIYAMTWHGFFLGLIAFFFGFCFVLTGSLFWNMLLKWKWLFLLLAISLYVYRLFQPQMQVPNFQLAIESNFWIFSVFAFGYKYLNHPSKTLGYLSQAAYPVYIVHMVFLYLSSLILFPLEINVYLKFVLVLLSTFIGSLTFYEFIIRRINIFRPLFGLKNNRKNDE
jgi:hypothetical protein